MTSFFSLIPKRIMLTIPMTLKRSGASVVNLVPRLLQMAQHRLADTESLDMF